MDIVRDFNPPITYPNYLIRKRLLESIRFLAPRLRGRLMDFGCGQKPYKNLFVVDEYIGVDYENPGHPHINENIDVFYDGKTLPFADSSFDAVFSSEVFEHIFNLPAIIRELNRVTKPEGMMLITCPFAYCEHEVPNDYARYSSYAIRHLLEESGFEILEQIKTGNSIEALNQMWLIYIHLHIHSKIRSIPVLRSAFRLIFYSTMNLWTLLASKLLPAGKELYMNNVILCRKNR